MESTTVKRIGVLTGGGDAPGLNPAIKGLVYRSIEHGIDVRGLFDGWKGLLDPLADDLALDRQMVRRWDRDGGTNLGSSRTNPFKAPDEHGAPVDRSEEVARNIAKLGLDAVVACGGEDTLGVAAKLSAMGINLVGVPKTIDKDVAGTDYTLGFDSALRNITEIIELSRTPAGSHGWVQVVEVMGRHAGHLALWSGVAGGADLILIPEHPFRYERILAHLRRRLGHAASERREPHRPRYSVIVVAEGARPEEGTLVTASAERDAFGHERLGGIAEVLAARIRREGNYDARSVVIGYPQRGGTPSPVDRIMGLMFGARAADAVAQRDFGKMVSARGVAPGCDLSMVDISSVLGKLNTVDVDRYYDTERYHLKGIGM